VKEEKKPLVLNRIQYLYNHLGVSIDRLDDKTEFSFSFGRMELESPFCFNFGRKLQPELNKLTD
jgi:hypothetical protein